MKIISKFVTSSLTIALIFGPIQTMAGSPAVSPDLGAAATYAILADTYANGVAGMTLNGDLGYSVAPTAMPTFTNGADHANDSVTAAARAAQDAALADINGRACTAFAMDTLSPISPGVYCLAAALTQAASTSITLDGSGLYIFRIGGALTMGASSSIVLTGGATAGEIFWAPVGATTIGASGIFKGTIISPAGITLGAAAVLEGRALAHGGVVTTDSNDINADTRLPILAEVTPVPTPGSDSTPVYSFSSDEAGTITYGGACSSETTVAVSGDNIVAFDALADGTYADCTVTVTDALGNASSTLPVTAFTVSAADVTAPILAELTPVPTPATETTPSYTFSSDEAGTIIYGGTCTSTTTLAGSGNNTVTFNTLSVGAHNDCTITVTDASANASSILQVTDFTIVAAADTTAPIITQVTPVPTSATDTTPTYVFNSNEAGSITYAGDCSSATTSALSGNNTVTFNALSVGTHSNCTIRVTDAALNQSIILAIPAFTINAATSSDTTVPVLTLITAVVTPATDTTPTFTFNSNEEGTIAYGGTCTGGLIAAIGNNAITFNALGIATHASCTIRVTDAAGNQSLVLQVPSFTITAPVVNTTEPEGSDTSSSGLNAVPRATANSTLPLTAQVDYLVKLENDGNEATEADSTVYYIGLDKKRHPFISSAAYLSWYTDFNDVTIVTPTVLASITLGAPILTRPGTLWVKISSDPKTYYVEPGYKLRWIKDEATAVKLGGPNWNKNIVDMDVSFFVLFSQAAEIDTVYLASSWPSGTVFQNQQGLRYYVTRDKKRAFNPVSAFDSNHFQNRFVWNYPSDTSSLNRLSSFTAGPEITGLEDGLFSLMH